MIAIPVKRKEDGSLKSAKLFGRSDCFALIDEEDSISYLDNHFLTGVDLAKKIVELKVKVLITNHLGTKVYDYLVQKDIAIFYGNKNTTVLDLVAQFREGTLKPFDATKTRKPPTYY